MNTTPKVYLVACQFEIESFIKESDKPYVKKLHRCAYFIDAKEGSKLLTHLKSRAEGDFCVVALPEVVEGHLQTDLKSWLEDRGVEIRHTRS